jgi:kynurenine formamidase
MAILKDLSATVKNYSMDPDEIKIKHIGHAESARSRSKRTGLTPDKIGRKVGGANDKVVGSSHAGTNLLAPWHFGQVVEGQPAKTIDQVPLNWCYGNGVLLDFSKTKKPGDAIFTDDIKKELQRIDYTLKAGNIVLIRTGAEDYFEDDPRYADMGSGLVKESLFWLLDQGIKLIGTDAYGLDIPIPKMVAELKNGKPEAFFPVHYAAREREHLQAAKLFNLKTLTKPCGFKIAMFPIKLGEGSGAWTRAVAFENEGTTIKMPTLMERNESMVDGITHKEDARRFAKIYGLSLQSLPEPDMFASNVVSCSPHAGTHVDAPFHYGPIVGNQPAKTIDQFPLELCYGDGVLLDFSHKKPHDPITAFELIQELDRIGYELKPDDIVLIRSGAEDYFFWRSPF